MDIKFKKIGFLKTVGIFALIAGLVFIFSVVNVSAGGCCCYADSCLNQINASKNISPGNGSLKVDKFVDGCMYHVGDEVSYTIVVRNTGTKPLSHVTVEDVLPKDISVVNEGSQGVISNLNQNGVVTCDFEINTATKETGKVLKCIIPKLQKNGAVGNNVTIYYKAKVVSHNQIGNHMNTVNVNAFYTEWQGTGCSAAQIPDKCLETGSCAINEPCIDSDCCTWAYNETDVANQSQTNLSDLRDSVKVLIIDMEKITTTPYLTYGDTAKYEIKFNTDGEIVNASITDNLPNGFTYVNNSATLASCSGSVTHTGNIFNLTNVYNVSSNCILKYEATIDSTQANGDYVNNASATFNNVSANCSITLNVSASVHVERNPKLTVNKDVNIYKIYQPGDTIPFVIHVCNPGTTVVQNITLLDIVPYGYNFSSANANTGKNYRQGTTCSENVCSVTSISPVNYTTTWVNVTCAGGGNYSHLMTVGIANTSNDGSCSYTVNCTSNTSCSVIYNSCGLVKVEGDPLYNNETAGYKLTWCKDSLAAGTCWDIDVNFSALSESSGKISTNKVEVTANDGLLWKDVAPSVVVGQSMLSIEKIVKKGTVAPGDATILYTLNIINRGLADAINLTIVDVPAEAIQIAGIESGTPKCCNTSNDCRNIDITSGPTGSYGDTVTFLINGSIHPNEKCTFQYKVQVNPMAAEKVYPNTATLYANDTFGKPFPQISAQAYIQVLGAQASITKTVVGGPIAERVEICGNTTFEIKMENNGAFELVNIEINDTFPEGLEYLNSTPSANGNDSTHVWWVNPFNISAKGVNSSAPSSKSINVTFKVKCNATPGSNRNIVDFKAKLNDGTPIAGGVEKVFEIVSADLTITKRATPSQVNANEKVRFDIEIKNNAIGAARNVYILDNLSAKFSYNKDVEVVAGTCNVINTGTNNSLNFSINSGGNISGYQTCLISYTVNVSPSQGCSGLYNNTAELHYTIGDCNCSEKVKNASTKVEVMSFLRFTISKSADTTDLEPGKTVNFTLTVSNAGNDAIVNASVIDKLPGGFVYISCGGGNNCSNTSTDIARWYVDVPVGETRTLWVYANVTSDAQSGQLNNCANITADLKYGSVICASYNASACTQVFVHKPNVNVLKRVTAKNVTPNSTVTYELYVSNIGNAIAYNVNVSDKLPDSFNYSSNGYSVVCSNMVGTPFGGFPVNVYFGPLFNLSQGATCIISYNVHVPDNVTSDNNCVGDVNGAGLNCTNIVNVTYQDGAKSNYSISTNETITIKRDIKLSIAKSSNVSYAQTSDTILFTIVVTNDGANVAKCVNVTDKVPDGFEILSATQPNTNGSNWVNWTCQDIPAHGSKTYTINVRTLGTAQGDLMNNVTYYYLQENKTANTTVHILSPNLNISKWADNTGPIKPNSAVTYNILVKNTGDAGAANVVVNDVLPVNLIYDGSLDVKIISTGCTSTSINVNTSGQETNFTIGTLPASTMCWFTYNVHVNSSTSDGNYTNNVTVNGTKIGGTTQISGAKDNETIQVINNVGLNAVKTANVTLATPGDTIKFTIDLKNTGNSTIYEVYAYDQLPQGYNPNCSVTEITSGGNCSCDTTTRAVDCTFTNVSINGTAQFNITATLNATATSTTNLVTTTYKVGANDPVSPGPASIVHVEVINPNLKIYKNKNETIVYPGNTLKYEIIVMNTGLGKARNITVQDVRHKGFIDAGNYVLICGGVTQTTNLTNITINSTTINFTINHTMNSSETCHIYYDVKVIDDGSVCLCPGTYMNTVTIKSAQKNPTIPLNNDEGIDSFATTSISVGEGSNIKVVKTVSNSSVQANDTITFTINITNINGKNPVFNMSVTDTLPYGFNATAVNAIGNETPCSNNGAVVQCNFSKINKSAVNGIYQITITAKVNASANSNSINDVHYAYTNPCCEEKTGDTNAAINVRKPKLDIEKWTTTPTSSRGAIVEYCFRVRNDGGADVSNVKVHDVLQSPFTYPGQITNNAGGCLDTYPLSGSSNGNFTFNCTLNASYSFKVCYNVSTNQALDGYYDNTVNITNVTYLDGTILSTTEGIGETSSSRVTIRNIQKIMVSKSANQTVQPGQKIEYKIIVTNLGSVNWENGTVTDTLASDVLYNNSANESGVAGTRIGNDVIWTKQFIPRGQNKTYYINVTVSSNTSSPVWNEVKVEGENVSDDAVAITYVNKPDLLIEKIALNNSVLPGENVTYKIKIINKGYGDAQNITLIDVLPFKNITHAGNVQVLSCDGNNISIVGDGTNNATFSVNGSLHGGKYCEFTYNAHVWERQNDALYTNEITMNASDTSGTPLPILIARAIIQVKSTPGMFVIKNDAVLSYGTCAQGKDTVNFTINLINVGDVPLYDIDITDILPAGLTAKACTNNTTINGGTVNCTIENSTKLVTWKISIIPAKNTTNISVTATVECDALSGLLTNTVDTVAHKPDSTEVRARDYATVKICTKSDIEWHKSTTQQKPVSPGANISYTIFVQNKGESRATNITLTDNLPNDWTYNGGNSTTDDCGNVWNVSGTNIIIFTTTNFNGSSFCKFNISANVPLTTSPGTYCNQISGEWENCGTHYGPNKQVCNGVNSGQIDIKKEIYPKVVKHGDNVNYTVTIWNYGLENVSVNVSDYLPKGLKVVSCPFTTSSGQLCEGTVTIPARNNITYNIIANVTDDMTDQEFTNTIYADANVPGGHGKSSTVTGYVKDPKINIVKWADASDVEPGQEVTFYIQVQNPSETNLINLTISDILPNGFEYKYNSSRLDGQPFNESNHQIFNVTPGAYNESSNAMQQNITWNVSNIPGKTTNLLIYKAKVHCNITKGKDANVNKVCVNYSTHDNENGSACTNYTMSGHLANLTINKYADKNSVKWFDVVEYTVIIKNPAINSAHAILKEINDTMAKNLKYINNSATINGEKINPNVIKGNYSVGTTLIWNGSTINDTAVWVGTKVVLKYKVLIMTGSNGILDNNVSLEYYDPLPGYFDPEAVFRASFRSNIVRDGYTPKQSIVETKNAKLMLGDEINTPVIITSTIYLKQGWNLISLPIQPQDTNIDAVLNNIKGKYTDVFTYNNKWIYKSEYMNKWFGDLSNLEAGKGYWIKVKEDCNLTIDGLKVKSANISLEQGWNLIGPVTTTQDNISLDNLNVQYTDVFTYEGKWVYKSEYMNKWFGDLSNLEAGKGYWIKVENNETIRQ